MKHSKHPFVAAAPAPIAAVLAPHWRFPATLSLTTAPYVGTAKFSTIGWHCLIAPRAEFVEPEFGFFADCIMLPRHLKNVNGYVNRLVAEVRSPSLTRSGEADILLTGAGPAQFKGEDVGYGRAIPRMTIGHDFVADAKRRIELIFMPDAYAAARDDYVDLMDMFDVDGIVDILDSLRYHLPEAAKAFLELRIGFGISLIHQAEARDERVAHRDDIISQMRQLTIAYWMRTCAMRAHAALLRPYSFLPLDTSDSADQVRYGPAFERLTERLKVVEHVLWQHASISTRAKFAATACFRNCSIALPAINPTRWYCDAALERRALEQLAIWRAEHGADLEDVIAREVEDARTKVAIMKLRLQQQQPHKGRRKRARKDQHGWSKLVGNMVLITPLELLYHQIRVGVAYMTSIARKDVPAWLDSGKPSSQMPAPLLRSHESGSAAKIHALLRFAIVEDHEVLPMALRTDAIRTQADAMLVNGRRFSLCEFQIASFAIVDKRSTIMLDAQAREARVRAGLDMELARALQPSLKELAAALTS